MALRLTPAGDRVVIITEDIVPAAGVDYPTSRRRPGEVVRAHFDLFVPNDIAPG